MKSNYTAVGFVEGRQKEYNEVKIEEDMTKLDEILESKDSTKPDEPKDIRSVEDDNN